MHEGMHMNKSRVRCTVYSSVPEGTSEEDEAMEKRGKSAAQN